MEFKDEREHVACHVIMSIGPVMIRKNMTRRGVTKGFLEEALRNSALVDYCPHNASGLPRATNQTQTYSSGHLGTGTTSEFGRAKKVKKGEEKERVGQT